MRVLAVRPGPQFSVKDVHDGWVRALRGLGCEVVDYNHDDRLDFYSQVALNRDGDWHQALDTNDAIKVASEHLQAAAYQLWPDIVLVTSCFFVSRFTLDLLRTRGQKVVIVHTESPYEDEGQLLRAAHADLNVVNDPTNLHLFSERGPSVYLPAAYDPAMHHPRPAEPECVSDFCFVGTGFPSRVAFLEQVDWSGVDVALAGNWMRTREDSPLRKFLAHDLDKCCENSEAHRLYASTKASANLYRTEAEDGSVAGWAMGPREVELAASGTFFLRDPRPEGDGVLSMLPTFTSPEEFGEKLRWFLAHDEARGRAADAARAAVVGRTFTENARRMLSLIAKE